MAGIQVRKKDLGLSSCCKEGLAAMSENSGEKHIKVKIYCQGCLKIEKVLIREIRERRAA